MSPEADVEALYHRVLDRWNERDAVGYGELFAANGSIVGFDGSLVTSSAAVTDHLTSIFEDHTPATYVACVREVRELTSGSMLVIAGVGMVPPGESDINPQMNTIQSLVAVDTGRAWRVAHFQSTPAAFHGRPEAVEELTAELRARLPSS
jgi:uncharacterized protein (TIGR02246 family)